MSAHGITEPQNPGNTRILVKNVGQAFQPDLGRPRVFRMIKLRMGLDMPTESSCARVRLESLTYDLLTCRPGQLTLAASRIHRRDLIQNL